MRPASLHVLLVEDETDERDSCVALLESLGCRVDVAFDGGAAISRFMALRPDIVIVDLGLPIIDGFEAIRRIRQEGQPQPFVIAVTGNPDPTLERSASAAGADRYLTKPFDGELRAVIQVLVQGTKRARTRSSPDPS